MMTELIEVQPQELKFEVEVKKQSSCSIQLISKSNQYVAFKIKTTNPKKYCVRPNIGVIKPNATCDFTVTMQAQRAAASDLQCRDKFLIQSTVVPFGSTEEDIASETFAKDSGKYIEDKKLRVVLVSPPTSPVLLPVNGMLKQDSPYDMYVHKEKELNGVEDVHKEKEMNGLESIPPRDTISIDQEFNQFGFRPPNFVEEPSENINEPRTTVSIEPRPNNVEEVFKLEKNDQDVKLAKDVEDIHLKMNVILSKFNEAEVTIAELTKERNKATKEKELLFQELASLRRNSGASATDVSANATGASARATERQVQIGFPFLFVVMVALISLAVGYYIH